MRDYMMLGAMLFLVPLALRNTFGAYLLWGWSGLMAINTFMYGMMQSLPYVQIFALICLTLLLFNRDPERRRFESDSTSILFILFAVHAVLAATFAYPDIPRNWELCTNLLKTLLFCVLMPMLVTSRFRIHAMLLMLALASGFHGLIEGLKFISSGGAHLSQGNIKLGDRNHTAVMTVMIMPILLYLYQYAQSRLAKFGYIAVLVVNILSVISTQSRAGLLTLIALAMWVVFHSRRKVVGSLMILVVVMGVIAVAPDSWTNRMDTIKSADEDGSFMGRVMAWKRGSAIALENPMFGGGFHSVQAPSIFDYYRYKQGLLGFVDTPVQSYAAAAHSIYFEVMGDLGLMGFFIFLAILINAFVTRSAINRMAKSSHVDVRWATDLATLMAGGLLAYMVGGASISAGYFEMPYTMVMLMAVLKRQVDLEIHGPKPVRRFRTA